LTEASAPRRTALHLLHEAAGARFTDFGGWAMPLRYGSIIDEHTAVRTAAGLFDLSHMGELWVRGPGAAEGLAGALVNDARRLAVGRAQYSLLCAPDGGIIDDLIVYRTDDLDFLVVPNAANREVVAAELAERLSGHAAELADRTLDTSLVAIQGPAAAGILGGLVGEPLDDLPSYAARRDTVAGVELLLARTGYTGEDGFELFTPWADGPVVWQALLDAGAGSGLLPCGLGARDTLRLEAGMPLYGNELDRAVDPYQAGLGWVARLDGGRAFVGREALAARSTAPPERRLVGLRLGARAIARHGTAVVREEGGEPIGVVTSGSQSPTLGVPIAMAFVPPGDAAAGTMLAVTVRGTAVPAEVVPLPFYRRPDRG
jgi:aminomethyltransferase